MRRPGLHRWIVLADVLVVVWVGAWLLVGVRVNNEVQGLTELSATISRAGGAVEETGRALASLNVPVVGERLDEAATRVTQTGRDTRLSGRTARDSIADLSTLLGVSVALIPFSPVLFLYLPMRVGQMRERRALRRLLDRHRDDSGLERLLAHRALQTMSYRQLEQDGEGRFWAELAEGRYGKLAAAERRRFHLDRPLR
jgi:hypothetical protein